MAHVLIVDDDEDFVNAVSTVLRAAQHDVSVAHDPAEALDKAQQRVPDVMVLDVMFPENPSAGFELARTLRRKLAGVPILMLTAVNREFPLGFSNKDLHPEWLPAEEFLEKPVDFDLLCEKVNALTRGQKTAKT